MIEKLKRLFTEKEILEGSFGIEREALRVNINGELSYKMHPKSLGSKGKNQYITTDFAESQIEVITPVFSKSEEVYNFTNVLYDIVSSEMKDEYLWPQSMPCEVNNIKDIKVAQYDDSESEAQRYREDLLKKYGVRKQLICGIHYNFSFKDEFLKKLHKESNEKISYKDFKDNIYLKMSRNYIRYRWLLIYLTGASPALAQSYINECERENDNKKCKGICAKGALSYRNSECGYKNKIDLFPQYTSVKAYVESINKFINDGIISSHKELYNSIRLKAYDNDNFLDSLNNDGIKYLEYRSIDINPFEKGGISLEDLYFLQVFNIFLLLKSETDYEDWQHEALINAFNISKYGLNDTHILKDGKKVSFKDEALNILNEIKNINTELNVKKDDVINIMINKVNNVKLTYAYKIHELINMKGYKEAHLELSKEYKNMAYANRFKLYGYEDMELSTQILMKEAIKKGIEVEILDRNENFICLKQGSKKEYVKQATKTSKDNYVTVLMMENKSVTKKVLKQNNIRVPEGNEINSISEAEFILNKFKNKPVVIKPKSTNFGTGISIFKNGSDEESLMQALKIAFKYDNTVLVEEFIKGKEYRFLVINNKVCGILHRVPANVQGDGRKSIRKLVEEKNENPLRGYNYITPLEKIKLDENAELFLNNNGMNFDYIPKNNEIIYLRENSNISTGGDSIDYTDLIPDRFKDIAVECAKGVNAEICGVDMMIENYKDENSEYGIIELNFNPAIHIHCYPYSGKERNIAIEILKLLGFNL